MNRPDQRCQTSPTRPAAAIGRDLRWLLAAASTVIDRLPPYRPLPLPFGERQRQWLNQLEADGGPDLLGGPTPRRLGEYFERLLEFYFRFAPELPFRYQRRGVAIPNPRPPARTLGEMDFLLAHGNGLMHLEVAVKFYLRPRAAAGGQWLGVDPTDTLARKLDRLRHHQLPVSRYSAYAGEISERRFLLKGALFRHWQDPRGVTDVDIESGVPQTTRLHRWLYNCELEAFLGQSPQTWKCLGKPDWLGAGADTQSAAGPPVAQPCAQMAVAFAAGALERIMIVPDTWPSTHPR